MSQKDTDSITPYQSREGFSPAESASRAGPLRDLVDFPGKGRILGKVQKENTLCGDG
ncbi:MAG: hypothetical protein ACRD98_10235 [Nitrososphaera sp.]